MTRRFLERVHSIIDGYDSTHCTTVTMGGVGTPTLEFTENDPWIKLIIPGASDMVYQCIGDPDIEARLILYDAEAVDTLFRETDIQSTAGSQYAVTATGRNRVEYFIVKCQGTKLSDNSSDTRETKYSNFTFADGSSTYVYIRSIRQFLDQNNIMAFEVAFYATAVSRTDDVT